MRCSLFIVVVVLTTTTRPDTRYLLSVVQCRLENRTSPVLRVTKVDESKIQTSNASLGTFYGRDDDLPLHYHEIPGIPTLA